MRICAALCWHDESTAFLSRCISSLNGVVDELVAVDGAWSLYPGEQRRSPRVEEDTIWAIAGHAGIPAHVYVPEEPWASQVEKRAYAMERASEDADWVFVIDADEYVVLADQPRLYADLESTDLACAYVGFRNLNQGETMPGTTPTSGLNRRLFRAGTTVRIVHSGYFYEGRNVLVSEDALDLRHCLSMEHDNVNRGTERNARARAYRRARQREGVENWVTA